MIKREITELILKASKEFPALTLIGPRQSGKTTLLRSLFPPAKYVHLEEPDVLEFAREDPRGFIQAYSPPVILDEIQYAPQLFAYIKRYIDDHRDQAGQFFLTGSQNFSLMESMSESLAGRTSYLNLFPLSWSELSDSKKNNTKIEELCFRGFYPEIIDSTRFESLESYSRWQGSYIRTFIDRDVHRLANVGDLNQFERFVRLCAARTGQLLNLSELGRDCGVEQPTAKRWLSILQTGFVAFELLPYHQNFSKRLVKSPKIYFYDVGICRYLMKLNVPKQLRLNQSFGALFENLVIADILKTFSHHGLNADLSFFRTSDKIEVDLVVSLGDRRIACEIKATATPKVHDTEGLKKWKKLSGDTEAYVLCLVPQAQALGNNITALPWYEHSKIFSISA